HNDIPKNSDKLIEHAAITIDMFKIDSNTKAYIDATCQTKQNPTIPLNQYGKVLSLQHNYALDTTSPQQQFSSQQQEATYNHNLHA
ncbi:40922_t:CDS:2, partial [Gigaspora margarita]